MRDFVTSPLSLGQLIVGVWKRRKCRLDAITSGLLKPFEAITSKLGLIF